MEGENRIREFVIETSDGTIPEQRDRFFAFPGLIEDTLNLSGKPEIQCLGMVLNGLAFGREKHPAYR